MKHKDFYKYELLTVAQRMHSAAVGSGDCPQEDKASELVSWMRMRLGSWEKSSFAGCIPFDAQVRAICETALVEFVTRHGL